MKTFKILFAIIATVTMFAACGDPDNTDAPTITFPNGNSVLRANLDATMISGTAVFTTPHIEAPGEIKTIVVTRSTDGSSNTADITAGKTLTDAINGDRGKTSYDIVTFKDDISAINFTNKIVYSFIVTDKNDKETTGTYTINASTEPTVTYAVTFSTNPPTEGVVITINNDGGTVTTAANGTVIKELEAGTYNYTATKVGFKDKTDSFVVDGAIAVPITMEAEESDDLDAPTNFPWSRSGTAAGNATPFGLKFHNANLSKATYAPIVKDNASKFVKLTTAPATKSALKTAVDNGTDIEQLKEFNVDAATTNYDVYLATKVGEEYFLIHVTKGEVTSSSAGTTITLTTTYTK
jgi:hypothetical protein